MDYNVKENWFSLSLVQQMVNIGNEVKRALRFSSSSENRKPFLETAIKYTTLSMEDPKNAAVLPELSVCKEVLEDYGGPQYLNCTKEQIAKYFAAYQLLL